MILLIDKNGESCTSGDFCKFTTNKNEKLEGLLDYNVVISSFVFEVSGDYTFVVSLDDVDLNSVERLRDNKIYANCLDCDKQKSCSTAKNEKYDSEGKPSAYCYGYKLKDMNELREVYVKIGTEVENKIPKDFIESKDFWNTIKDDTGYIIMYLNNDNQIID